MINARKYDYLTYKGTVKEADSCLVKGIFGKATQSKERICHRKALARLSITGVRVWRSRWCCTLDRFPLWSKSAGSDGTEWLTAKPRREAPKERLQERQQRKQRSKSLYRGRENFAPGPWRRVINCEVGVMNGPPSLRSEDKWMRVTEPSLLWILCELKDTNRTCYGFQDSGVLVQWTEGCLISGWTPILPSVETGLWVSSRAGWERLDALRLAGRRKSASPKPRGLRGWAPTHHGLPVPDHPLLQTPELFLTYWVGSWPAMGSEHFQMPGTLQGLLISDRRKPLAVKTKLISEGTKVREVNHRKDAGTLFDTSSTTSIITTYSLIWINFKVLL